jgi:hypothetical protein
MANTAASVLNEANKYVGVKGRPNTFTRDYAGRHGNEFLKASWCDMFTTYVSRKAKAPAVLPNGDRAYTVWHANDFAGINRWRAGTAANIEAHAAPGDVIFFDWNGTDSRGAIDHVGFVVKNLGDGRVITIEGNTSDSVAIRVRGSDVIAGFGQPRWVVAPVKPIGKVWPYAKSTLMRKGWMNSAGVKKVQDRLNALGYKPVLVEDGDFGAKTEVAVKWFQRRSKIQVDGIVGPITWGRLFA